MGFESLNDILDFAVKREREAILFYKELQDLSKFSEQRKMLFELETMERGHIEILENIRYIKLELIEIPEIKNLKISDYLVKSKPTENMSYQDILISAIKKEESSNNFYNDLASIVNNPEYRKLFLKLASEEAKHKLYFEKIYDDEILKEN
ncbi:hypothetical protein DRP43_00335 [candidate division TA06 bacterium]|uniref:Rubrerythrin diiron-binding domain-containing protein n=1 Tax=candidate division TA06 bacterium TaxID=2250710 RepID=A0A660SR91_UNCT6|nr:MAG: hypothetical protein DRP43_00335 [candidate division TA06 bacterium]